MEAIGVFCTEISGNERDFILSSILEFTRAGSPLPSAPTIIQPTRDISPRITSRDNGFRMFAFNFSQSPGSLTALIIVSAESSGFRTSKWRPSSAIANLFRPLPRSRSI